MPVKAIIYDLDNTIFPVSSIGEKLFKPVFDLIAESGQHNDNLENIKKAIMRTPFRIVAQRNGFSDELTQKGIEIQDTIDYQGEVIPFEDYPEIRNINSERFLVTTGFRTMQLSKIRQLGITEDFKEIHVVNPVVTSKKEVFADILKRFDYLPEQVIVIGDDPESEIAAAKALGIPTVLYDKTDAFEAKEADYKIKHFAELAEIVTLKNNL